LSCGVYSIGHHSLKNGFMNFFVRKSLLKIPKTTYFLTRGSNQKKWFLDWIWVGNPKPKKIHKSKTQTQIQNPILFLNF
jgi:hypothetical protein